MNIKKLKEYLKKEIREVLANSPKPSPSKPQHEPDVLEPGTKEPTKPKRRTLQPDRETTPTPKPKAGLKENEKQIIDKIAKRFKDLNKND